MGRKWTVIFAATLLVVGLGVLLYPAVSSIVNEQNGSYAIAQMENQLDDLDDSQMEAAFAQARAYNESLLLATEFNEEALQEQYEGILDFGNGIMGYVKIPKIDVKLPIYHGVTTEVLDRGVGHLSQSAFPVGGLGNHTVLTGHTGLPSAKLFTDLNLLGEGDQFYVSIGGVTGTYRVDQIKVVLPSETDDLLPQPGADHCTLVTCTPYGVNSHRLLVRGVRIEEESQDTVLQLPEEQKKTGPIGKLWLCFLPLPLLLLTMMRKRRRE